jgi:hypothetical protein
VKLAPEKIGGFITEKLVIAFPFFRSGINWHALGYGWRVGWIPSMNSAREDSLAKKRFR